MSTTTDGCRSPSCFAILAASANGATSGYLSLFNSSDSTVAKNGAASMLGPFALVLVFPMRMPLVLRWAYWSSTSLLFPRVSAAQPLHLAAVVGCCPMDPCAASPTLCSPMRSCPVATSTAHAGPAASIVAAPRSRLVCFRRCPASLTHATPLSPCESMACPPNAKVCLAGRCCSTSIAVTTSPTIASVPASMALVGRLLGVDSALATASLRPRGSLCDSSVGGLLPPCHSLALSCLCHCRFGRCSASPVGALHFRRKKR